jgi:hypothetical protein
MLYIQSTLIFWYDGLNLPLPTMSVDLGPGGAMALS